MEPAVPWLKYGCVLSWSLYTVVYGFGVGPICWFLSAELAPPRNRSRIQVISPHFTNQILDDVLFHKHNYLNRTYNAVVAAIQNSWTFRLLDPLRCSLFNFLDCIVLQTPRDQGQRNSRDRG